MADPVPLDQIITAIKNRVFLRRLARSGVEPSIVDHARDEECKDIIFMLENWQPLPPPPIEDR